MFQNIQNQQEIEQEEKEYINKSTMKTLLQNVFSKQKILVYIISFMLSTIECTNGIAPFAIAIFAACYSNKIPTIIVYILTIIGTFIGLGSNQALIYILTSVIFIAMTIVIRPKFQDDYNNEKIKLGKYVFLSVFLVQASQMLFGSFMVYDLLQSILMAIASYIFYKIFANSLIVINEFGIKKAFAIEEVIGASIMLTVWASAFRDFSIFGFEIKNILTILIVLVLGWKNGILVGATTGITIGTIVGIINGTGNLVIGTYALSGLIAGVFSKFGRIGVIVGFILGNALLQYLSSGITTTIIYFREILIASLALLAIPKNIEINIEDLFGKTKLLSEGTAGNIESAKQTIYKLNNVSETIQELSNTYKEVAATTVSEEETVREQNKKLFLEQLENSLEEIQENIIYDDLSENQNILNDIFDELTQEQKLTRQSLLKIFADNNNFIVGFDGVETSIKLEEDLNKAIQVVNEAYRISKMNFICKQKIEENKKNLSEQLDGVSKVIANLAQDLEQTENESKKFLNEKEEIFELCMQKNIPLKDIKIKKEKTGRYIITTYIEKKEKLESETITQLEKIFSKIFDDDIVIQNSKNNNGIELNYLVNTFLSKDRYLMQIGIAKAKKEGSLVSGDSMLTTRLNDGKYLLAISDGMGSGAKARQESQIAIKMLERLLTNGFAQDTSIELINTTLSSNSEESFATLDIAIADLYAGNIEFIKNAACPTYVKHNKNVQVIKSIALPAGILNNINLVVYDKDIEANDIMFMCSDGILESNTEYKNKELWIKNILEELITDNVQKIADIVLRESIDNGFGQAKDDMTIICTKFIKI